MRRRPNTQTIQWFLETHASGQLNLNPHYQRRSVWSDDYRRFFIDSVLRDYPAPAIYLQTNSNPGAPTIHNVIDGKQRLEAIIEFTQDEFHLGRYFEDEGLVDAYFSDLPEARQEAFVDYVLSVENISRSSDEEIRQAFERLNRNTAKLNRQELRKAQFAGVFISRMTALAEHEFWTKIGAATRSRISRMQDVEYVSEIFLLTMHGILEGSADLVDNYYADYDDEIPDEESSMRKYTLVLTWLDGLPLEWKSTRWRNLGDFYSLWAAVLEFIDETESGIELDAAVSARTLTELSESVSTPDAEGVFAEYYGASRQGTSKESNRRIRTNLIKRQLENQS